MRTDRRRDLTKVMSLFAVSSGTRLKDFNLAQMLYLCAVFDSHSQLRLFLWTELTK